MTPDDSPAAGTKGSRTPHLQLVTEVQRATHVLGLHLEAALADLSLSQAEMHVLSLLAGSGSMSVTELQRGVRHRPSTLTGILDRLAARRLVQRRINEADRRSNLIKLTSEGRAAAGRVAEAMAAIERAVFEHRPPEDHEVFRQILGEIADLNRIHPA